MGHGKSGGIKTKMMGISQRGIFVYSNFISYNQLWVFGGPFINYQAQVGVKYNSP